MKQNIFMMKYFFINPNARTNSAISESKALVILNDYRYHHRHHKVVLVARSFPILSQAICFYCPSLRAGFLNSTQCPNRAHACKSLPVGKYWRDDVEESKREHPL